MFQKSIHSMVTAYSILLELSPRFIPRLFVVLDLVCLVMYMYISVSMGAFTRPDIGLGHLLPVINVATDTALPRQKDHTVFSGAMSCQSGPSVMLGSITDNIYDR